MNELKIIRNTALFLCALSIISCSAEYMRAVKKGGYLTITGTKMPAITPDNVKIYTGNVPCKYEEVGLITVPGQAYSADTLYQFFKERAAEVGASIVDVQQIDKNIWEYRGTAIAGRCLTNRNKK